MKFIALQESNPAPEKSVLAREYDDAVDFTPARIGEERLFFRSGRRVYYIALGDVSRCFRRVELVNARMGCCNQGLPMESVVVCGEGEKELAQIRLASERMGVALLDALKTACPGAKFGYDRPPEQTTAVRQI